MEVYVCLPKLALKKAKLDREIYVLSLASDLRGESNHRPAAAGQGNEVLSDLSAGVEAAMKFMVMSASQIFHHIDKDQPLPLGGDGIVLYPPADPQGMLALQLAIVESDKGARTVFEKLSTDKRVKQELDLLGELTAAAKAITAERLMMLMQVVSTVLSVMLKDDILFNYGFAARRQSSYQGSAAGVEHRLTNKAIEGVLKVYCN